MIFDPKTRQFISKGRAIPRSEIHAQLEEFITEEKDSVDQESKKVLAGTLAPAAFFSFLRDKIKHWHSIAGVIAYGGQSQMNLERWKRINEKVQSELAFLDKWQVEAERGLVSTHALANKAASLVEADSQIPSGLETVVRREVQKSLLTDAASRPSAIRDAVVEALADSVSLDVAETVAAEVTKDLLESERMSDLIWGSLSSRGRMYTDGLYGTYETSVKYRESDNGAVGVRRNCENDAASCDECVTLATDEYVGLDEITDIGDATCLSNCRCVLEFSYLNVEPLEIDRNIYA